MQQDYPILQNDGGNERQEDYPTSVASGVT